MIEQILSPLLLAQEPSFQAYIFWAYGLTCVLIALFTAWTIVQNVNIAERVQYLKDRLERAHPEAIDDGK